MATRNIQPEAETLDVAPKVRDDRGWLKWVAVLLLGLSAPAAEKVPKMDETKAPASSMGKATPDDPLAQEEIKVPAGCKAKPGTAKEPYTNTGWAKEVIHEASGIELVYVPAGSFVMGSPVGEKDRLGCEAQHPVTISKGFYLGKTEVTQAQWRKVMNQESSHFKGDDLPVEQVSWDDCHSFCQKAGGLRLPTEAEWEYACRAGNTGPVAGTGVLSEMGWSYGNSGGKTREVAKKRPNAWGLYDMQGNVWEWCSDWYVDSPTSTEIDPMIDAATGAPRVCRGSGWKTHGRDCRAAIRSMCWQGYRNDDLGFRVVLVPVVR